MKAVNMNDQCTTVNLLKFEISIYLNGLLSGANTNHSLFLSTHITIKIFFKTAHG